MPENHWLKLDLTFCGVESDLLICPPDGQCGTKNLCRSIQLLGQLSIILRRSIHSVCQRSSILLASWLARCRVAALSATTKTRLCCTNFITTTFMAGSIAQIVSLHAAVTMSWINIPVRYTTVTRRLLRQPLFFFLLKAQKFRVKLKTKLLQKCFTATLITVYAQWNSGWIQML